MMLKIIDEIIHYRLENRYSYIETYPVIILTIILDWDPEKLFD